MLNVPADIRGLIFDCDGTLADTMPAHTEAWCETFAAFGFQCPDGFIDQVKGMSAVKIVEEFNRRYHQRIDAVRFAAEKNRRARNKLHGARPIAPVVAIARTYHGRLPMAVASGGTRENVLLTLAAIGLQDHFVTVLTADDPVRPKPSPDIFLEAARRLHVDPGCCQVFEDGDAGLEAARNAGMLATDVRPLLA